MYLESVGAFINLATGIVYPAFDNNIPDLENGVSLVDDMIPGEWLDALSSEDYLVVEKFIV